jgi:acetoin utilization deacetylase AcuC-like enzyme
MNDLALFYPQGHAAHRQVGHPERPERVEAVRQSLEEIGVWQPASLLPPLDLPEAVLHGVHSPAYLSLLERACLRGGYLDADTYVTQASWQLARQAAGGAAAVAQAVWGGDFRRGFALCRPPGHHAMRGQGMGFCLLNNIALAAEYLIRQEGASRIAIVDLDLHHGNGTQDIFWARRDVFFISTHQMPLYPGTGALRERGAGEGEGYTANFPMPPGSGDEAYLAVMEQAILPLLERYQPEMILVSYGFDPHWSDPLGSLLLSAAGYGQLIAELVRFADANCQGRLALVLEGGYDLEAAAECSQAVVQALLNQPWQAVPLEIPYRQTSSWQGMLKQARQLWEL